MMKIPFTTGAMIGLLLCVLIGYILYLIICGRGIK